MYMEHGIGDMHRNIPRGTDLLVDAKYELVKHIEINRSEQG